MARSRTPADPLEGLSPDELRELTERANALMAAQDEADEAADDAADPDATPADDDAAAQAAAAEAAERERLEQTAGRIGLTDEQTTALLEEMEERQARVTERVVRALLEEYAVPEPDDPDPDPLDDDATPPPPADEAASLSDLQDDPDATPAPPPEPDKPPEATPETTHWFNRPLFKKESDPE